MSELLENKTQRIKNRKLMEKHQKVVYEVLEKALQAKALSHAYLFVGPEGCMKKEMALLLAQSIFCGSDELIKEDKYCYFEWTEE